jgi:hypothetical protein
MRMLRLFLVILLAACDGGDADRASRGDGVGGLGTPLQVADLFVYQAGRKEEIALLHSAAGMTANQLDSVGAQAADLPVEDYRRITAAVDDYLKARSARVAGHGDLASSLDSALSHLDSLRVERLVLLVRTEQ